MSPPDPSPTAGNRRLRILVPLNANDDSRWGVQYALRRHAEGRELEVIFLSVGEPITEWEVLRSRTQVEIAQFQAQRAEAFIEEAGIPLNAGSIPCRGLFKQGDVVFLILDAAEELACDEIVMPKPGSGLLHWLSRNISLKVKRQQRAVPVVLVDRTGAPVEYPVKRRAVA